MNEKKTVLSSLTKENIRDFSEEQIFELVRFIQTKILREERAPYIHIIDSAFKFRTISSRRRDLKQDHLMLLGYIFFKTDDKSKMMTGVLKAKRLY
ncbi:MAG: hypothetical protein LUF85_05260 [Bacteroides sp.]|nr:hypothetical protein [Bacteroides sp.]